MTDYQALLAKLLAYDAERGDFHSDRQLSDECLIATGWNVERDEGFEGGFSWWFGTNPRVCVSESSRPHLIHNIGAAIGARPYRWLFELEIGTYGTTARTWAPDKSRMFGFEANHSKEEIAVLMACIMGWQSLALVTPSPVREEVRG